ncbi:hypothetical protein P4571_08110 [Niallia alba]|uniref:hypothetical protein n=1 Tax=Niallia alba TaxID=2729105 RepID=UPI002E223CB5|nr:hypothetical protein [Niallia alba]
MKTEHEIQQNNITELLKLIDQNPELPIVPMVDGQLCGDDWSYYMGKWGQAEIDEVYHEDERVYFKSSDEEELIGERGEFIFDNEYPSRKSLTDEEEKIVEKKAEEYVESLPWKKVIVVSIELP